MKSVTPLVGAAIAPELWQYVLPTNALQIDFTTGQNMKPSWYTWAGGYVGCANRPAFRSAVQVVAQAYANLGVTHLQHDDPEINYTLASSAQYRYGSGSSTGTVSSPSIGCFCPDCQSFAAASGFGTLTTSNMRSFQAHSTTNYWTWYGGMIRSNTNLRISANHSRVQNLFGLGYTPQRFDYPLVEVFAADTTGDSLIRDWAEYGGHQVATYAVTTQSSYEQVFGASDRTRRWMAGAYALGLHPIVPWDVYANGVARVFAARSDVADLTGFVRAKGAELFDDFNLAGAIGETRRWPDNVAPAAWASTNAVLVTVRYRDSDGARLIHAVDLRDNPGGFTLNWWGPVVGTGAATIHAPAAYDLTAQNAAIASGNRSALATASAATVTTVGAIRSVTLGAGLWRVVEVTP